MEITINTEALPKFISLIRKAISKGMNDKEIIDCIIQAVITGEV